MTMTATCLVSKNSGLVVREYHGPECIAITMYYDHRSRGQGASHQTYPNHEEHIEAIE